MTHLFICTMFAYRIHDLTADINVLCRLSENREQAVEGLDTVNRTAHPEADWAGHSVSAGQAGDELVLMAAQAVRDSLAVRGTAVDGLSLATIMDTPQTTSLESAGPPPPEVVEIPMPADPSEKQAPATTDGPLVVTGTPKTIKFIGFGT
jgi:hypothetical protein